MLTREEILEIYKAGPEAVVNIIEKLISINEKYEIRIYALKDQIEVINEQNRILGSMIEQIVIQKEQINELRNIINND